MNRSRASRAIASLLRATVPSAVAFIGLTVVIAGILAMHVWMGGHGSTSHHVASPTIPTTITATIMSPRAEAGLAPGHTADMHAVHRTGPVHTQTTTAVTAAAATAVGAAALDAASSTVMTAVPDGGGSVGCAGDCSDEMMLGMCVLAMIVVGLAGLLTPTGRALLSTMGRRGPPVLSWVSRSAPAPSLTQLCISRT